MTKVGEKLTDEMVYEDNVIGENHVKTREERIRLTDLSKSSLIKLHEIMG